nr:Hsp20 family protein [Salipiger sp. PrR003]
MKNRWRPIRWKHAECLRDDIEKVGEDEYQVTLAVAGFTPEEMTVTSVESSLEIIGEKKTSKDGEERTFRHRGIAQRKFKHTFTPADYVRVVGAKTENGLLIIDLVREVPESQKPRTIEIKSA